MVPGVGSPSRGKHSPQEEPVDRPQDDPYSQVARLRLRVQLGMAEPSRVRSGHPLFGLRPTVAATTAETLAWLLAVVQPGAEAGEPAA